MSETREASADARDAADGSGQPVAEPAVRQCRAPVLDRTGPLLVIFFLVGVVAFLGALLTVHTGRDLTQDSGAVRMHVWLSQWLNEGYFHHCGLHVLTPVDRPAAIYRSSSGGPMLSAFMLQKLFVTVSGRYSWRLVGIHNQIVSLVLSALLGLLAYRLTRRFDLDARRGLAAGAMVVSVVFTFPDNLALYRLMSGQAYALLFATLFLLIEERRADGRGTLAYSIGQAVAAFLMAYMDKAAALAFITVLAATALVLEPRRGSWRRLVLVALIPWVTAVALHGLQLYEVSRRFPDMEMAGSSFLFRSGLDGESRYYLDHFDIAWRRDWARQNWPANRDALFRWPWVFMLGTLSTLSALVAYMAGRVPRIVVEVLTALVGAWVLYAAVFSQSMVIHPYLYDVLLFVPLAIALFAVAPALLESLTRRTGAILLVVMLCAGWYSLFQMRLYALRYPMPNTIVGVPPANPGRP